MNIDVIRNNISLPMLNKGDRLVIHNVGAYNMTQWMRFITMRPAVMLIASDGSVNLIRNKESVDTIQGPEVIPEYLR